jgi:hypothetical protein
MEVAEESEKASAMMRVGRIKYRQTMLFSESHLVECADKANEILEGEDWLGAYMKRPHIQQSAIDAPFSAGPGNFSQNFPALLYIHAAFGSESDEFAGPDDL